MNYFVFFNQTARKIYALTEDSAPAGSIKVGEFVHNGEDPLGYSDNHVLFHHIREIFYKVNSKGEVSFFPDNITDFAPYKILLKTQGEPESLTATPDTISFDTLGDTEEITVEVLPGNPDGLPVVFESDDEDVATVSNDGVVTAIGNGTATITVSLEGTSINDTVEVTVASD